MKLLVKSIIYVALLIGVYTPSALANTEIRIYVQNMFASGEPDATVCIDTNHDFKCTTQDQFLTKTNEEGIAVIQNVPPTIIASAPYVLSSIAYSFNRHHPLARTVYSRILRTPPYFDAKNNLATVYLNPVTTLMFDYGKYASLGIFDTRAFLVKTFNLQANAFNDPISTDYSSDPDRAIAVMLANAIFIGDTEHMIPANVHDFIPVVEHYRSFYNNNDNNLN